MQQAGHAHLGLGCDQAWRLTAEASEPDRAVIGAVAGGSIALALATLAALYAWQLPRVRLLVARLSGSARSAQKLPSADRSSSAGLSGHSSQPHENTYTLQVCLACAVTLCKALAFCGHVCLPCCTCVPLRLLSVSASPDHGSI